MSRASVPLGPSLLDERSPTPFRDIFGRLLGESVELCTAIRRIRLTGVDLTTEELQGVRRMRILVAEINAQTLEDETFGLLMDPVRRDTLGRIQGLLASGRMELRSAPLAGWSPDFSVFSGHQGPRALLLGLHWVQRPFPHRGPAWLSCFGPAEARMGGSRFDDLWRGAHEIGPAVLKLFDRAIVRWQRKSADLGGQDPPDGTREPTGEKP